MVVAVVLMLPVVVVSPAVEDAAVVGMVVVLVSGRARFRREGRLCSVSGGLELELLLLMLLSPSVVVDGSIGIITATVSPMRTTDPSLTLQ